VFPASITNPEQLDGYVELDVANKELVKKRIEQSRYEVDIDTVPVNPDELVRTCWTIPEDAPEQLTTPLLNYQREGLGWMVHQEQCQHHGGILADEMGMG
jgi:DNA repair protein RAD16